jgi:F-type H+-transporting ATPase subunit a
VPYSGAPNPENTLIAPSLLLLPLVAAAGSGDGGFEGPSTADFFPGAVLFAGTPFELNRVMLIRILATVVLLLVLWLGSRKMTIVPSRGQAAFEFILNFVRKSIVIDTLGEKDGKRFMGVIMGIFFGVLAMNITGVIPGLQIAGTSVIGVPLVLAILTYVLFIYAGINRHGVRFFKNTLILPGVPIALTPFLALLEFLSTFILRPVTLTLRLLMNMVAGHMLLVLCFAATQFFFFTVLADGNLIGILGVGTFAFGIAFTVLEIFVAALQAYVFAILTAIYIQMALAEEH